MSDDLVQPQPKPLIDPQTGQPLIVPRGIFTSEIKKSVESILAANVPEGKRGALLAMVDPNGAKVGVVAKLDKRGNWKLGAEASKAWSGPITGMVMLHGSF